jgi:hypothetical protein
MAEPPIDGNLSYYDAAVRNMIFFILGHPTQTKDDILRNIEFLGKNKQYISFFAKSLFNLQVNPIYTAPERFYITKLEENPDPLSPCLQA